MKLLGVAAANYGITPNWDFVGRIQPFIEKLTEFEINIGSIGKVQTTAGHR
jgi:hypothetical protein